MNLLSLWNNLYHYSTSSALHAFLITVNNSGTSVAAYFLYTRLVRPDGMNFKFQPRNSVIRKSIFYPVPTRLSFFSFPRCTPISISFGINYWPRARIRNVIGTLSFKNYTCILSLLALGWSILRTLIYNRKEHQNSCYWIHMTFTHDIRRHTSNDYLRRWISSPNDIKVTIIDARFLRPRFIHPPKLRTVSLPGVQIYFPRLFYIYPGPRSLTKIIKFILVIYYTRGFKALSQISSICSSRGRHV